MKTLSHQQESRYISQMSPWKHNAALRCERRLAILERSETAKRCESLLNALLKVKHTRPRVWLFPA